MTKATLGLLTTLFFVPANRITQELATVSLNIDLSAVAELPELMVIKKHGLGEYEITADTTKITVATFTLNLPVSEPEIQDILFIWPGGKRKLASFRAFPSNYQVSFNNALKLSIENTGSTAPFEKDFEELENLIVNQRLEVNNIIGKVDYENRKIENVEREISKLKDSMEMVLDEKVYRQFVLSH